MTEPVEIKEPLHCLSCGSEITMISDIQNPQPIKKNNIVICAECAAIHKVGDSDLVKFSKEDFGKLDAQSKHIIGTTVATILARHQRKNN